MTIVFKIELGEAAGQADTENGHRGSVRGGGNGHAKIGEETKTD